MDGRATIALLTDVSVNSMLLCTRISRAIRIFLLFFNFVYTMKSHCSVTQWDFFFGWFSTTHCAAYYSATHNERQTMTIEKKKSLCCMVSLVAIFLELCCKN